MIRTGIKNKFRKISRVFFLMLFALFFGISPVFSQLGFFEDYWQPVTIENPEYVEGTIPAQMPGIAVSIDVTDTIQLISPYVGGYNLNTYNGGKMFDKPVLLENIQALDLPVFRFPGGSGSNWYFWNKSKPNLPEDVDFLIIKDETVHISDQIKWGDIPGSDYLSLDNSYILRDSCNNEAIHVVNYSLARYGRAEDPVAQAAHLAAEWVRYDNGRTRFWEIGNEIYGSWEPGYIIDTERNKDGQPRVINGQLYGEHCKVFLDSMRAAAVEIGAEIKIGATLGFQETRSEWDIPLLQTLGNEVDFYIVHKYFGNREDAEPNEVLQSIDEFHQHKDHIDNLINTYCESYVPLVLTEWNTRYEGSKQNVSCTNGMHNLLGYKAIINEGIGLSCKWNLIWTYKDGNTHGLITSEKDNASIEGIPAYFPRAPYFYIYYFKQFLGDVSVNNKVQSSDSLDIFSSLFTSGHTGVSLVNKSESEKSVVINLENYNYGDRFYWYHLIPENGRPFSPKVKVNGQTNENYDAGGPLNFKAIKPNSSQAGDGIRLKLPPFSATFVLTEGSIAVIEDKFTISFDVFGEKEGQVTSLTDAVVQVGPRFYLPDEAGKIVLSTGLGDLDYQIHANGHESKSGTITVSGDALVSDTLVYTTYEVNLSLLDSEGNVPIPNCSINLDEITKTTDAEGSVNFTGLDFGKYQMQYSSKAYKGSLELDIFSDTSIILEIPKTEYQLEVWVRDSISKDALISANIKFNDQSYTTSLDGNIVISSYYGNYQLTASKDGYKEKSASIELSNDTLVEIMLLPETADVKFKLYDGISPVNNAEIRLQEQVLYTNALGLCTFKDLETGKNYDYSIYKEPWNNITGTLELLADTTIELNYADILNNVEIRVIDSLKLYPLSGSEILFNDEFKLANEEGIASYEISPGSYELRVATDRYHDYYRLVHIAKDTVLKVPLKLNEAIIRFKVIFNNEPLQGASVSINELEYNTNSLGVAVFNYLFVDSSYHYSVVSEGFNTVESSLSIVHDSTITIEMFGTDVDNYSKNGSHLFPVPAGPELHIKANFRIKKIIVLDTGMRVKIMKEVNGEENTILETESLEPGIYFINILDEEGRSNYKKFTITN